MSTTAVIIEHLVSGLQAVIWIALLVLTLFGYTWIPLDFLKDFATEIGILVFAFAYPLGIFIDEVSDSILKSWSKSIRRKRFGKEGLDPNQTKATAFYLLQRTEDEFVKSYFNYIRMRIRLSRSGTINFGMLTISAALFTLFRTEVNELIAILITIPGLFITALAAWAWYGFTDTFAKQTARLHETLPPQNPKPGS